MSQSNDQQERDVSVSHSGIYDLMLFRAQSALHEELCVFRGGISICCESTACLRSSMPLSMQNKIISEV